MVTYRFLLPATQDRPPPHLQCLDPLVSGLERLLGFPELARRLGLLQVLRVSETQQFLRTLFLEREIQDVFFKIYDVM